MTVLNAIRVLDLTRILAGPFCTQVLADHGADVWKIERPAKGDDTRAFGPPFIEGQSTYFMSVNRGKRSVAVDLKHPEGLAVVRELAAKADVVVENFRPGTAQKLGLGAQELRQGNPRLIYCSMSGFGHSGPWAERPGYDLAMQGLSGLQSLTGQQSGPPTKAGLSIADLTTGLYAAQGILLALFNRERTGQGEVIDIAMLDSMLTLLTYQAGIYFADGSIPRRRGNQHPTIVPYETFETADGYFNLAVGNDRIWRIFCDAIAMKELADDPRYVSNPQRVANHGSLFETLSAKFAGETTAYWLKLLGDAAVPCGPIQDVGAALENEQSRARAMVVPLQHPVAGTVNVVGSAARLQQAPAQYGRPPPLLGEHTEEVLCEVLGYDRDRIHRLVTAKALATASS